MAKAEQDTTLFSEHNRFITTEPTDSPIQEFELTPYIPEQATEQVPLWVPLADIVDHLATARRHERFGEKLASYPNGIYTDEHKVKDYASKRGAHPDNISRTQLGIWRQKQDEVAGFNRAEAKQKWQLDGETITQASNQQLQNLDDIEGAFFASQTDSKEIARKKRAWRARLKKLAELEAKNQR